jgi:hypothetical protein
MTKVKRYVWQFADGKYATHHSRFPAMVCYHYRYSLITHSDADELKAKMWKTRKGAERALASAITKAKDDITRHVANTSTFYQTAPNLKVVENACDRTKGVVIVELEFDEEDTKKARIRFRDDTKAYDHSGIKGNSTGGKGHTYCRICGMILKDLPYFDVGSGWKHSLTVCPLCILEQAGKAKQLLDGMDQSLRKEMEAERFLRKI